ncbi:MAG: RNA polymerase sigma factor [Actinobacteria bacterium]|nr:RNA polymerase sigma factor [Actinomycetota bacterium]
MAVRSDDVDSARDRALVERFQAGDPTGFEDLYRRYYDRLYRFCLKRIDDPDDAEEVTQESFLRAFRALSTFGGERRFYPWLSVIAARLCIDNYRRQRPVEPAADVDPGVVDGGQQAVIDAVDLRILDIALTRISARHRDVLLMREEAGWSYDHIATHLGVTIGTVEALLWRARRALRREYLMVMNSETVWAGIPVLGGLGRFAARLRARLARMGDHAMPALANSAVSMVVVVASAGAIGVVGPSGGAVAATGRPSLRSVDMATLATSSTPALPSAAATMPGPARASAGDGAHSSGSVVRVESSDQRQPAEASVETPLAGIDVNPSVVMDAAQRGVETVRGQL